MRRWGERATLAQRFLRNLSQSFKPAHLDDRSADEPSCSFLNWMACRHPREKRTAPAAKTA
jgi:hypothetical protein